MTQFARVIGLEDSLAAFGMLGDVLLKIRGKTGKMLVTKAVDSLLPLVGQGPQLWRVLLRVNFILCPLLQNRLVVILLWLI